jgi:hypothetical protein
VRPPLPVDEVIHVRCVNEGHQARPYLDTETPKQRKARRAGE